jgi:MFS family permease
MAEVEYQPPASPPLGEADTRTLLRFNNLLALISTVSWSIATPFVPLYLASLGAPAAVVGLVLGTAGLAPLLISVHAGAVSDERGPVWVAKASLVVVALAAAILVGVHSIPAVALGCALIGVGNIGFAVSPQAIVAAVSAPATRVRDYSYYFLWGSVGSVLGPLVGGIVAGRFGYLAVFALVGLLMAPGFAIAALMRDVRSDHRPRASLATAHTLAGQALRQPGVSAILFITFIVACGQQLQQSFFPLYLGKVGLSATRIGIVVAMTSLSSILVRSLLSRGVLRFGYVALLLTAVALAAISLGVTPLVQRFWPLMGVSALMGVSSGFTQPLTMSLIIESVGAEFWGMAIGLRQAVQRLAQVVSPVAFGLVITGLGIGAGFFVGALTLGGAVPIMAATAGQIRSSRPESSAPPAVGGPETQRSR